MQRWRQSIFGIALTSGVLMLAMCGGDRRAGQGGQEVGHSASRGTERAAGTAGMAVPAGFPHDVPLYTGATVIRSRAVPLPEVRLRSSDDAETIISFYRETLPARGWVERTGQAWTLPTGDEILAFRKGRDVLTVRVAPSGRGTLVILNVAVLG